MIQSAVLTNHQEYLAECLEELRRLVHAASSEQPDYAHEPCRSIPPVENGRIPAAFYMQKAFGLTSFEFWCLLLAAGCEYDESLAHACSSRPGVSGPSVSFALRTIPAAHWDAFTPDKVLRRARLLYFDPGPSFAGAPFGIPEKVLHFINGCDGLDQELIPWCAPLSHSAGTAPDRLLDWLKRRMPPPRPMNLYGSHVEQREMCVVGACQDAGFACFSLNAEILDLDAPHRERLFALCMRDALLSRIIWFIDAASARSTTQKNALRHLAGMCRDSLVIGSSRPVDSIPEISALALAGFTPRDQARLWSAVLRDLPVSGSVRKLTGAFNLNSGAIRRAASKISASMDAAESERVLWNACRQESRIPLPEYIDIVDSRRTWEDLVLPETQMAQLRAIAIQVRCRFTVVEEWGFGHKSMRGLGLAALFHGASGTGKTLAAEVLAGELNLDMLKVDLSNVISKYIGETEQNLARVFDAATRANAIVFFDEADALFGKRTDVKDAHDRYANIEISYLLQRMETFPGLSILTTNLRDNIDDAFTRRIRFSVSFPFPDESLRQGIWARVFPARTPCRNLDTSKLAQLRVCGGSIQNIALHAAYLAADEDGPVAMRHLLEAARFEYAKMEKSLTESEIKGWLV